jgi:hypothetical protein
MATICGNGIHQEDLVTFLTDIATKHNATLAKLDADTGVTATDYVSGQTITLDTTKIQAGGINQDGLIEFLQDVITKNNAVLAKLDADGAITATDWGTTGDITDVIDSTTNGNIYQNGLNQSQLVHLLQAIITSFAATTAKLDADDDINTATYAATGALTATDVDSTGCNA